MSKKQIIYKIVNDLPMSDMLGKMTKEEWYGWFEECWDKAINYTHSSLKLKDKQTPTFEDWVRKQFIHIEHNKTLLNGYELKEDETLLQIYNKDISSL